MPVGLRSVINSSFINSFVGIAQSNGEAGGNNLAQALNGNATRVGVSDGLRLGARAYSNAVAGLNSLIGGLSVVDNALSELGDLTSKMINLVERATTRGTSSQAKKGLEVEFRRLGSDFRDIVENTEFAGRELLNTGELNEIFNLLGISKEDSSSIAEIFDDFVQTSDTDVNAGSEEFDNALAAESIRGERPHNIPAGAFKIGSKNLSKVVKEFDSVFSTERTISRRPDAYRVLHDLEAMQNQIQTNRETIGKAQGVIIDNIEMVRFAGLAMLDISGQITSEDKAEQVAAKLRAAITKAPAAALAQAENLQNIAIAGLSLDEDDLI